MPPTRRPRPLFAGILIATQLLRTVASQEVCDYSLRGLSSICLNVDAQGSTSFAFPPLFQPSSPAKFVYAIDDVSSSGRKSSRVAFWMEYNSIDINSTTTPMYTEMNVLFTANGKSPSGDSNGCQGLLGSGCVDALKSAVRTMALSTDRIPFYVLNQMLGQTRYYESAKSACPQDLLDKVFTEKMGIDNRPGTINKNSGLPGFLASEDTLRQRIYTVREHGAMPPGNNSFTWGLTVKDTNLQEQSAKAAVAIIVRYPVIPVDDAKNLAAYRNQTSDIRVELVCAKPGTTVQPPGSPSSPAGPASSNGGTPDSGKSLATRGVVSLSTVVSVFLIVSVFTFVWSV